MEENKILKERRAALEAMDKEQLIKEVLDKDQQLRSLRNDSLFTVNRLGNSFKAFADGVAKSKIVMAGEAAGKNAMNLYAECEQFIERVFSNKPKVWNVDEEAELKKMSWKFEKE